MPFHNTQQNSERELNVQQLDTAMLSNLHEWDIYAQTEISFRHIVEENPEPRPDAARYKLIADVNLEAARAAFSRACSSTTLFKIPPTVTCDRTFARDAGEAYYVDAMHKFLYEHGVDHPLKVEDLPILKWRLHSRYFSAFSRRHIYFSELFERRRSDHWIPGDSPDLEFFSDLEKAAWFPKLELWLRLFRQPSALPIPVPFSLYFYHTELRNAQRFPFMADSERVRRLKFGLEHEFYILVIAVWWNELYHGGKAFVLTPETINILQTKCGNIPDIVGKPAQAIIERMRMFADMPTNFHNWISFADGGLENSAFIFAVKKVGVHDHTISSGRRLWYRRDHRNVFVSPYSSRTYRRLDLLEVRISGPDLDEIPGLLSLVKNQDWARYNSLRVGDLLDNMLALYKQNHVKLESTRELLPEGERRHDQAVREIAEMRRDLDDRRHQVDDKNYEIHGLKRQLDNAYRNVDAKKHEASGLRTQLEIANRKLNHAQHHINYLNRRNNGIQLPGSHGHVNNPTPTSSAGGSPASPQYTPSSSAGHVPDLSNAREQPAQATIEKGGVSAPNCNASTPATSTPTTSTPRRNSGNHGERVVTTQLCSGWRPTIPTNSGPANADTRSSGSSPSNASRRLPRIRPGYPFFKMPPKTGTRSAQTNRRGNEGPSAQETVDKSLENVAIENNSNVN